MRKGTFNVVISGKVLSVTGYETKALDYEVILFRPAGSRRWIIAEKNTGVLIYCSCNPRESRSEAVKQLASRLENSIRTRETIDRVIDTAEWINY